MATIPITAPRRRRIGAKGLVILICYVVLGAIVFQTIAAKSGVTLHFFSPHHANYKRELRDSYVIHDLTAADPKKPIYIHLTEGGYGDEYKFPVGVRQYDIRKSAHPGDYATVWCNGDPEPKPIVEYYVDGLGGEVAQGCRDFGDPSSTFRVQGQGDLAFYPTVYNHQ